MRIRSAKRRCKSQFSFELRRVLRKPVFPKWELMPTSSWGDIETRRGYAITEVKVKGTTYWVQAKMVSNNDEAGLLLLAALLAVPTVGLSMLLFFVAAALINGSDPKLTFYFHDPREVFVPNRPYYIESHKDLKKLLAG